MKGKGPPKPTASSTSLQSKQKLQNHPTQKALVEPEIPKKSPLKKAGTFNSGKKKMSTDIIVVRLQKPMFPVKQTPNKYIDLTADLSPTTPNSSSRPGTRIASPKVQPL